MDGDEEAKCEGENVEMNVEFCCWVQSLSHV